MTINESAVGAVYLFIPLKVRHSNMNGVMTEPQRPHWISKSDFFQDSENYQEENCDMSKFYRDEMISQYISLAGQIGKAGWHVLLQYFVFLMEFSSFAQADLIGML